MRVLSPLKTEQAQRLLLFAGVSCGLCAQLSPTASIIFTIAGIWIWSRIRLYLFISDVVLRRIMRFAPFLFPIRFWGLPRLEMEWRGNLACLICTLTIMFFSMKSYRILFSKFVLSSVNRENRRRRYSESLFYFLSSIGQEYVYRYVLILFLAEYCNLGYMAVLISSALFVIEHRIGDRGKQLFTMRNIAAWSTMGMVYGTIAFVTHTVSGPLIGHILVNLPNIVYPHLKGLK